MPSTSRTRSLSAMKEGPWWPERGGGRCDHSAAKADAMMPEMSPAAPDIRPRPSPTRRRAGGGDRSAPSSLAIWPASDRAAVRPCREAPRRAVRDHTRRALPLAGEPARAASSGSARRGRSRVGTSRPRVRDRRDCGRDGDRGRTACRASAQARPAPRAQARVRRAVELGCGCRRPRECGPRDRPRPKAGRADRRASGPMAPVARWSGCAYRVTAAMRSPGLVSRVCQDRPGNPRPQGDHLRADRDSGLSIGVPVERRNASSAKAAARRIGAPAEAQAARKSGLRRSHSHANPRASNVRRAR